MSNIHFSGGRDEWTTPEWLREEAVAEFGIAHDLAATSENAVCDKFYTMLDDALEQDWHKLKVPCWLNPPYSKLKKFTAKAADEAALGATVVGLVPARPETVWWNDHVLRATEIRFLMGRLHFSGSKHPAPFPSALVIWTPPIEWPVNDRYTLSLPATTPHVTWLRRYRNS